MFGFIKKRKIIEEYKKELAQSARAAEYTNYISSEGKSSGYEKIQSDSEASVMLDLWECSVSLHCQHSQAHSGLEW